MTAVIVLLSIANVALVAALVALIRQAAVERRDLIDVVVSRHAGDIRVLRREAKRKPEPASAEVAAYEATRDRELRAMGYDPADVPRLPAGLDGM